MKLENTNEIFVLIVDETYGGDEETYFDDSENYRKQLEQEFHVSFVQANIGAGADIPSFLTTIATTSVPLWAVALGTFFLGKPINENIRAWREIAAKIHSFFQRPLVLSRNGAAALAIEAVLEEIGGIPKSFRLISYRSNYDFLDENLETLRKSNSIEASPPVINLGHTQHVFEIEADGTNFRVGVNGKDVALVRI